MCQAPYRAVGRGLPEGTKHYGHHALAQPLPQSRPLTNMEWAQLNLSSSLLWLALPLFCTLFLNVAIPRTSPQHISQSSGLSRVCWGTKEEGSPRQSTYSQSQKEKQ